MLAASATASGIRVQPYGVTSKGAPVEKVVLENDNGMRLAYIDYGATLVAAEVADRRGKRRNVMLSLPDLAAFEKYQRALWRHHRPLRRPHRRRALHAGRQDGAAERPTPRGVAIHGDPDPYDKRVWRRQDFADRVVDRLDLPPAQSRRRPELPRRDGHRRHLPPAAQARRVPPSSIAPPPARRRC
jgi:aldose 1-epimerase